MNAPHTAPADRDARRGFALLVGLVATVGAGKAVLFDGLDSDLFWHLRVAEQIGRDGVRPLVDGISFASVREPWTPYSWAAELLMSAVWRMSGVAGAVLGQAICVAAMTGFVAAACVEATRVVHGRPRHLASGLATAGFALFSLAYVSFRPVLFALVLMSACAWLVWRDRRLGRASRAVWLVPLLVAITVNLHLSAVLVVAWLVAVACGEAIDRSPRAMRAAALAVLAALACCCTPLLPGVVAQAFAYHDGDVMVAGGRIAEMAPFHHGGFGKAMLAVAALTTGLAVWRRRELGWANLLWLAVSTALLLRWGRFAPVYAMAAMPILAAALPELRDAALGRPAVRWAVAAVLMIGLGRIAWAAPRPGTTVDAWVARHGPDAAGYPAEASAWVEANVAPRSGRLLNEFTWGGYLAWRLGDRWQVFVDGRTQLYPAAFWRATYLGPAADARPLLEGAGADAAVLPVERSRFRPMLESMGWRVAHADGRAVVLLPPTGDVADAE